MFLKKADSKILNQHDSVCGHACYCTEPRMRKVVPELIHRHYGWDMESMYYDLACLSGGGGGFTTLNHDGRAQVLINEFKEIGCGAHGAPEVVVLNHQDCGAYKRFAGISFESGKEVEEREFHVAELRKAYQMLIRELPGVKIHLGYVFVTDEDVWDIEKVPFE